MAPGCSNQQTLFHPQHGGRQATPDTWIQVTEIQDDDLQFGGKSLSEWYEEERRRLSQGSSSDDEASRGRPRARKHAHHGGKKH